ncbi:MAG: AmmeMemoRadiSam system protein B [Xanthomonadales bacterium]|nr:AmmeMemoRadiSam system protein B [Gammaproteobacteria bacterium]MBT8049797.1 AmmeMemoRadiSam system protein B [Gammaproteobacteria bacterium]NNJ79458.1 AmmeMemoRadiSam system protein B [Xanthomonadales bacterium]NNL05196.1 AmmeMemoRadiSam system protein B [Xanthomonadales bacterium]
MKRIRKPAVAGSFYPADPAELRSALARLLDPFTLESRQTAGAPPRALVVPHAGLDFSGSVAASAYARLLPFTQRYRRVVLLGPAHGQSFEGIALPGVEAFATPLGSVVVDAEAIDSLAQPWVFVDEDAHRFEHSIEVQLPFLQTALSRFQIVPLLVGKTRADTVARVIEDLCDAEATLLVVSTDLTHDSRCRDARIHDYRTRSAIESLDPEQIGASDACGAAALRGLLKAAAHCGLEAETLDMRNSHETIGSRNHVVGYGAWVFRGRELSQAAV